MNLNWEALKPAFLIAGLLALIQLCAIVSSFDSAPSWWQFIKLGLVPVVAVFAATMLNFIPKPGVPVPGPGVKP